MKKLFRGFFIGPLLLFSADVMRPVRGSSRGCDYQKGKKNDEYPISASVVAGRHDNEGGEEKGETKSMIYGIR